MIDQLATLTQNEAVRTVVAIAAASYLIFVLVSRVQSDEDPSIRFQKSSGGGTVGFLISGSHVTMALAGFIALVTWPTPIDSPLIGVALAGAVVFHYALEKREVSLN